LLRQSYAGELSSEGDDADTSRELLVVPAGLLQKGRAGDCSVLHPTTRVQAARGCSQPYSFPVKSHTAEQMRRV